jgi:hypothetical protein
MWQIIILGVATVSVLFCIILWMEQDSQWNEDVKL